MLTKDALEVAGLVVVNGKALPVAVDSPLLVLDVEAWAKASLSDLESSASKAACSELASDYESSASALRAWLDRGELMVHGMLGLLFRQKFGPRRVDEKCLKSYVRSVVSMGRLATERDVPSFLMVLDGAIPKLFCVESLRAQASYTGRSVEGRVVSQDDLDKMIVESKLSLDGALPGFGRTAAVV